ncbi:MAG: hypothetical protein ACLGIO_06135, partial [Acidimicrobiia bacterium]
PAPAPAPASRRLLVVEGCARHGAPACVHRRGRVAHRGDDGDGALGWLLAELNDGAIARYDGLAVHAGVVARHGRAIAFPAESGAGKTTLTAAAVAAGFGYLSDEALCVPFGSDDIAPYPRPLALSAWSRRHAGLDGVAGYRLSPDEVLVTPAALGAWPPPAGARLAHVVVLRRRPGPPALEPASAADAMAALLRHSFHHYKRPPESFARCASLAGQARAWRLGLSDPADAAALLAERLGAP